jgi:release factor glutamine methyltransferase
VESASLESEMLLCHILGWQRHELYLRKDYLLTQEQFQTFKDMLERRLAGEPVQYITGTRYFMGLPFYVDKSVLIPRWETELLTEYVIEKAKKKSRPAAILDLGTGSGAIAVSLAVNLPAAEITAVDIKDNALSVARKNAKANEVFHRINFYWGDLFLPLESVQFNNYFDIIVSNPPYIPTGEIDNLMTEVKDYEPVSALDGGADGLDFYHRLAGEAWRYLKDDGLIAMEIGYGQSGPVQEIFLKTGLYHSQEVHKDLVGIERFVVFYKKQGV